MNGSSMDKKHLGKKLKVGEGFISVSKQMMKGGAYPFTPLYKLYRKGDRDYFVKGKRRYYCEVKALVETRTGFRVRSFNRAWTHDFNTRSSIEGGRYWQFSYLVQILEN